MSEMRTVRKGTRRDGSVYYSIAVEFHGGWALLDQKYGTHEAAVLAERKRYMNQTVKIEGLCYETV